MDLQKEREAFEAYMAEKYKNLIDRRQCLDNGGVYMAWDMNFAWGVWQAAKAQAIPEGFILVPKEPIQEMLDSARDWSIKKYGKAVGNDGAYGCYKAMIAAAQEQNGVNNEPN